MRFIGSEGKGDTQILLGNFGFENDDHDSTIESEAFADLAKTQATAFDTFPSSSPASRPDRIYVKGEEIVVTDVVAAGLAPDSEAASKHLFLYSTISRSD